jgi:hypothetical protein
MTRVVIHLTSHSADYSQHFIGDHTCFAASDNDTVNLATDPTAGPAQHTSLQTLDLDTPFEFP